MACTIDQSFTTSNATHNLRTSSVQTAEETANQFTAGITEDICQVILKLAKVGSPTGNIFAKIYTNNAGEPGTLLANGQSANIDVSTLSTTAAEVTFTWSGSFPSVTSTTLYWVAVAGDWTLSDTNYVVVTFGTPGAGSAAKKLNSGTWATIVQVDFGNMYHKTYTQPAATGTKGLPFLVY